MAKANTSLSMPLCMTDLLFNLIGFLILLIAISSFEEKVAQNEKILLDLNLSEHQELAGSFASDANIFVNLFIEDGATKIEIDGKIMQLADLEEHLKVFRGNANLAIRCDRNILVGFHDDVLASCKRAGISNINQIVKMN